MLLKRVLNQPFICSLRNASTTSALLKISSTENDQIFRITLNNQRQRNVLSLTMINDLIKAIEEIEKQARVIILTAGDQKVFSSGHSLKELHELSKNKSCGSVFDRCTDLMMKYVERKYQKNTPIFYRCKGSSDVNPYNCRSLRTCCCGWLPVGSKLRYCCCW